MGIFQLSGAGAEPLSVDEVKAHVRIDGSSEDALLQSLILTSRLHIEAALGLALIAQSWRLVLDQWPKDGPVKLPISPVRSVSEMRVLAANGTPTVVDAGSYGLDTSQRPARIMFFGTSRPEPERPFAGIEIDLMVGFGEKANDVPEPVRQALLLLVAHWYEHRDPIEIGKPTTAVPHAVSRLLHPYRAVRL
ncbi:MAG: head-tail connector protein [Hyphomicrobiaceae bacterium]